MREGEWSSEARGNLSVYSPSFKNNTEWSSTDSKQLMISGLETDVPPAQLLHACPLMMTAQIESSSCGKFAGTTNLVA